MIVEYNSNNSGGSWWLEDEDWYELEKNGWKVAWYKEDYDYKDGNYQPDENGFPKMKELEGRNDLRWLGCLAKTAFYKCENMEDAIRSFETITGKDTRATGCECCGEPHSFYQVNYKQNVQR